MCASYSLPKTQQYMAITVEVSYCEEIVRGVTLSHKELTYRVEIKGGIQTCTCIKAVTEAIFPIPFSPLYHLESPEKPPQRVRGLGSYCQAPPMSKQLLAEDASGSFLMPSSTPRLWCFLRIFQPFRLLWGCSEEERQGRSLAPLHKLWIFDPTQSKLWGIPTSRLNGEKCAKQDIHYVLLYISNA